MKKLFFLLLIFAFQISNAQEKYFAIVSQEGKLSFRINEGDFYFYISQSGKITGYGSYVDGNISYDVYGNVDRIGTTNISYNVYQKIDRVGDANISYDVQQRVDKIGNIAISYNVMGKIDRFASENISYNVYDKVDRIGRASVSYDVKGNVDRINDSEGFIVFRFSPDTDDN